MTQATPYFPLGGGIDLITPAIAQKPGSAIGALNYEPVSNGYRRVEGFERFDGQPSPTDATYYQLDWTNGTAAFAIGDTITGALTGATARVIATGVATSGIYDDGSAAGYVGLDIVTDTFATGEELQVGGITRAISAGQQQPLTAPDDQTARTWQAAATANARALIEAVPGFGSVRGVWVYVGNVYAWRDSPTEHASNDFGDWTPSNATLTDLGDSIRVTNDGAQGFAEQTINTVVGTTYRVSVDVTLGTAYAGGIQINSAGGPVGDLVSKFAYADGTLTATFVATTATTDIQLWNAGTTDGHYTDFANVSIASDQGAMYVATVSGWDQIALGYTLDFTSGGTHEIVEGETITGATSGATAVVKRIVTQSGSWSAGTAAGYIVLTSATGTFQAENLNVGATTNVATIAGNKVPNTLPAGGRYDLINFNFSGTSLRMYGCNGVGEAFEFDGTVFTPIRTGMDEDTPHRIAEHQNHLFLAFPGGQLQNSSIGEPLDWSAVTGAAAFALGDEITDLIPANAGILTILAQNKVANLYGTSAADFQLQTLSDEAGALPYTADKVGEPIYMDKRGLRALSTTQAYGDFNIGTLSQKVKPLIQDYAKTGVTPVGSVRVRNKDHYRIFFSNEAGLTFYLGKPNPEILPFNLGKTVSCVGSFEMDEGERVFMGCSDGFVYELEKGYSFDGGTIEASLRLPFNHQGAPQTLKRWHKVVVECQAIPTATISVAADFDYGSPFEVGANAQDAAAQVFTVTGGGGIWDISNWNQFFWSGATEGLMEAYLDGVGRNMSLLIASASADEPPHLLQGLTLFYTVRGLQR